jgi:hypothetical protein
MNFAQGLLSAVAASDICSAYYRLCLEHPIRLDTASANAPAASIVKAATGNLSLKKLVGPGTVLQLGSLPESVSLNFIVQGCKSVETDFVVPYGNSIQRGTFAILCNAATSFAGDLLPNPPHPRPNFHSMDELIEIFGKFNNLVRELAVVASHWR